MALFMFDESRRYGAEDAVTEVVIFAKHGLRRKSDPGNLMAGWLLDAKALLQCAAGVKNGFTAGNTVPHFDFSRRKHLTAGQP
jgi:hypothetical protein